MGLSEPMSALLGQRVPRGTVCEPPVPSDISIQAMNGVRNIRTGILILLAAPLISQPCPMTLKLEAVLQLLLIGR